MGKNITYQKKIGRRRRYLKRRKERENLAIRQAKAPRSEEAKAAK